MKISVACLMLVASFFFPVSVYAVCDVQEVIEMVNDDMSTRMISDACKEKIDVPDCSLSRVIRMARGSSSEGEIYDACEGSISNQSRAPKQDLTDMPNLEQNNGLPSGTPVRPCGCWGYVNLGAVDAVPECASGLGEAVACSAFCLAGGVQWGVRCL